MSAQPVHPPWTAVSGDLLTAPAPCQAGVSRADQIAATGIQGTCAKRTSKQELTHMQRDIGGAPCSHGQGLVPKSGYVLKAAPSQEGSHIDDPFQPRPAVMGSMDRQIGEQLRVGQGAQMPARESHPLSMTTVEPPQLVGIIDQLPV